MTTFGNKMTLWERFENMKIEHNLRQHEDYWRGRLENIFREQYPEMPDLEDLAEVAPGSCGH